MENKINIAELLKDCPQGMELDCTIWDNVTFDHIDMTRDCPIYIRIEGDGHEQLTEYGQWNHSLNAKCVIFPKGKTTWEGFVPPCKFKEGDIISNDMYIAIFYKADRPYTYLKRDVLYYHCWYNRKYNEFKVETDYGIGHIEGYKLATEEEKQKLFDAIKAKGYKWNEETKTLEKLPKFKVGDRVKKKDSNEEVGLITDIADNHYIVETKYGMEVTISVYIQDDYVLIPNKFDITALNPFDKVLVRDHNAQEWVASLFSNYNESKKYKYICVNGSGYAQCIPYEENKHLLGTTNDCDEYYKTW